MSTLLQHATVLYYDNGWQTIQDGYIGIRDETIDYLGSEKPQAQYDEGKDMSLHLVMPGFYNMHTHTGMSILRGIGSALPLGRWLTEAVFRSRCACCHRTFVPAAAWRSWRCLHRV
jgi:5-methylthioadenosine/S-adenosylhomocysteine deaminase